MKKFIALLFCLLSCFGLFACKDNDTAVKSFIALENDKTLVVGGNKFTNVTDTVTEEKVLQYTAQVNHTLHRVNEFSALANNAIKYMDYYYYWTTKSTVDEEVLGTETTVTTILYSYLPFAQDQENIVVKKTVETTKTYDYQGGFKEKRAVMTYFLNGYFDTMADIQLKCPELYDKLTDTDGVKEYYVDTTAPTTKTVDYETFTDTYYYFE